MRSLLRRPEHADVRRPSPGDTHAACRYSARCNASLRRSWRVISRQSSTGMRPESGHSLTRLGARPSLGARRTWRAACAAVRGDQQLPRLGRDSPLQRFPRRARRATPAAPKRDCGGDLAGGSWRSSQASKRYCCRGTVSPSVRASFVRAKSRRHRTERSAPAPEQYPVVQVEHLRLRDNEVPSASTRVEAELRAPCLAFGLLALRERPQPTPEIARKMRDF